MTNGSLTLGLRALTTLARRGPLDVYRLAGLHGCPVQETAAVLAELERDGLVQQCEGRPLFAVTPRGASLFDGPTGSLH